MTMDSCCGCCWHELVLFVWIDSRRCRLECGWWLFFWDRSLAWSLRSVISFGVFTPQPPIVWLSTKKGTVQLHCNITTGSNKQMIVNDHPLDNIITTGNVIVFFFFFWMNCLFVSIEPECHRSKPSEIPLLWFLSFSRWLWRFLNFFVFFSRLVPLIPMGITRFPIELPSGRGV